MVRGQPTPIIVPEIISQLRHGRSLSLGNTKPRRDYVHTADCARSLRGLAHQPPGSCQTVNIASGQDASVDELVGLISELLDEPIEVTVDPARFRQADKLVQKADIGRLGRLLSWQPEMPLRTGMQELLQYEKLLPRL